jgi:hypothetical protein
MIKNRKDIADEWAEDSRLSYAEVGRIHNLDRRTVWSIVRSYYQQEKIEEIMAIKRSTRRKIRCETCQKLFEVRYPCLKKYIKLICDECKPKRVSSRRVKDIGESEGSK